MRFFKKCFVVQGLLLGLVLAGECFALPPGDLLVWGKVDKMKHNIYLSQQVDGIWSAPIILASDDTPNVLPTLIKNSNGEIWLVWTALNKGKGKLRYRHFRNGEWGEVSEIETGTQTDLAPSLQVDAQGVTWLVWAGLNGDDDIYFSHWSETGWTVPEILNVDDSWPDILPLLDINEKGQVRVTWSGYNGNDYVDYWSVWDGQRWTLEEELVTLPPDENDLPFKLADRLPKFLDDTSQAALYLEKSIGLGDVYYRDQLK